nr:MAG TPA: hypothetical protein [Caudoviricetes sp.]
MSIAVPSTDVGSFPFGRFFCSPFSTKSDNFIAPNLSKFSL